MVMADGLVQKIRAGYGPMLGDAENERQVKLLAEYGQLEAENKLLLAAIASWEDYRNRVETWIGQNVPDFADRDRFYTDVVCHKETGE